MENTDCKLVAIEDCVEIRMTASGIEKYELEDYFSKRVDKTLIGIFIDIPTIGEYLVNNDKVFITEIFGDNDLESLTPYNIINTKENMDRLDRYLSLDPSDRVLYDKVNDLYKSNESLLNGERLDISELYNERGNEFNYIILMMFLNSGGLHSYEMSTTCDGKDAYCHLYLNKME